MKEYQLLYLQLVKYAKIQCQDMQQTFIYLLIVKILHGADDQVQVANRNTCRDNVDPHGG